MEFDLNTLDVVVSILVVGLLIWLVTWAEEDAEQKHKKLNPKLLTFTCFMDNEKEPPCPVTGKLCGFYAYQKDRNDEVVLEFCNHYQNPCDEEGNCEDYLCPLLIGRPLNKL